MFKAAIAKYLAHRKEIKAQKARDGPVKPCGKQSVKELIGQNQGVSNVEVTDPSIRQFDRVARKYGVDYANLLHPVSALSICAITSLYHNVFPHTGLHLFLQDCAFSRFHYPPTHDSALKFFPEDP